MCVQVKQIQQPRCVWRVYEPYTAGLRTGRLHRMEDGNGHNRKEGKNRDPSYKIGEGSLFLPRVADG